MRALSSIVVLCAGCSASDALSVAAPAHPAAATTETTTPEPDRGAPIPASSDVCAVSPKNVGSVVKRTTTAAGKPRTYQLSVPGGGAKPGQPLPIVLVLHGASDTAPLKMRDWFGVEGRIAAPVLAVYPQALERTRSDGTGGKVTRWDLSGDEDLAFFDAMLADLARDYCVDRAHVFVTGFSSGGNFSQQLACLRPKDVKGMAVVAGPGPFSDGCGGAVPAWMTHDANDDTLPVSDARDSRDFWAAENGCTKSAWAPVSGRPECQRNTSCPAEEPVVYCETTGVGHAVPGYAPPAIGAFFTGLLK